MTAGLGFFVLIVLTSIQVFWGGYVISVLWHWFVVPLGVMSIGKLHAAGLAATFSMFMGTRGLKPDKDDTFETKAEKHRRFIRESGNALSTVIALPLAFLFLGWLIHAGM